MGSGGGGMNGGAGRMAKESSKSNPTAWEQSTVSCLDKYMTTLFYDTCNFIKNVVPVSLLISPADYLHAPLSTYQR